MWESFCFSHIHRWKLWVMFDRGHDLYLIFLISKQNKWKCNTCVKHMLMSPDCVNPACCSHSLALWRPILQYGGPGKSWFCQAPPVSLHNRASADLRTASSNAIKAVVMEMKHIHSQSTRDNLRGNSLGNRYICELMFHLFWQIFLAKLSFR